MKRPPNLAIAGIAAIVAFSAILLVRALVKPPGPWLADEALAFERARDEHKGVVIDLTATWSVPSVETSHLLDKLDEELDRDFIRLRLDVSNQDPSTESIRLRYDAQTTPVVLFLDTHGTVLARVVQNLDEGQLRQVIAKAAKQRRN